MPIHFPRPFQHRHPPVRSVNELDAERATPGQRAADAVVRVVGSWSFILIQSSILAVWVVLNVTAWLRHWDPYPFILMNLVLSLQAAYTAPMIMMSQNRQAARDRLEAHNDYLTNLRAEEEIRAVLDHLAAQDAALMEVLDVLMGAVGRIPPPPGPPGRGAAEP
ncbi:MAG TPA: DUF1003 domain-containing protein [Longimicrobiales bacterium]|nr:DUF1003 domain-containing protein [Longimicrobiales bacterium]